MARRNRPNRQQQRQQRNQAIKGQIQQNPMGRAARHPTFVAQNALRWNRLTFRLP